MTYGQALGIGHSYFVFASVITGFFTYLLYAVIDPSLQDQLRLSIEEQIVNKAIFRKNKLIWLLKWLPSFKNPAIMFVMSIFGGAFLV
jgi:hypothetical protein